ncbi:VOC family protein [Actinomadura scrupuli]|uniref:VOC family protein n=1 Tax=Actinomadura scrupuli TaxID=559629 RepID=UPI003D9668CC
MSDPFEDLRAPAPRIDPDPLFAERLRDRLARALLAPERRPEGTTMTTTTDTTLRNGDVGYASLRTPDAERAAAFYGTVLGWRIAPGSVPEGRRVEGLSTSFGIWGGQELGGVFLCFAVDDVAAAVRAVRAGGGSAGEPAREPYGLISMCTDDQGLAFAVYEDSGEGTAAAAAGPGEVAYLTIGVPDAARARAFYGAVLGWTFAPGRAEDGWRVLHGSGGELRPMTGLHGGAERPTVVPMYAVADIEDAVARVRAAGGTATAPERQPYGITAECADDQDTRFYLGQLG